MKSKILLIFLFLLNLPVMALEVVATTSSMGMLAREVGGSLVQVSELATPDRDVHFLQARPSMLRSLRDARLLIAVGADLEVGWLPAAIKGAANPNILPGSNGYFAATAHVPLLDVGLPADRAYGDVHVAGNPHVNLDPQRMAKIALALAEKLAKLDPEHSSEYQKRAKNFASAVDERVSAWRQKVAKSHGALLYHKDAAYMLDFLHLPLLGTLEPLPGVPPTASHLQDLITKLQGKSGVIIHTPYQPPAGAEKLASMLKWSIKVLPIDPPTGANAEQYFLLIDRWTDALAK